MKVCMCEESFELHAVFFCIVYAPLEPTKKCARVKKTCVDGALTSYLNLAFGFSKEGRCTLRRTKKSNNFTGAW